MPYELPTTPQAVRRRLDPRHAVTVGRSVAPMVGYLGRLRRRLEVNGFVPNDRLYDAAARAYDAVFTLNVMLHYDGCERPATEPAADWTI